MVFCKAMWKYIVLAVIFVALYLISPIDLVPDFFLPLGFLDDIGLIALAWWYLRKLAQNKVRENIQGSSKKTEDKYKQTEQKASKPQNSPYEVLGLPTNATQEEIEKAYRVKIKEYHPDRVHGLGEELQKIAREKTQEINAAYQKLKR